MLTANRLLKSVTRYVYIVCEIQMRWKVSRNLPNTAVSHHCAFRELIVDYQRNPIYGGLGLFKERNERIDARYTS